MFARAATLFSFLFFILPMLAAATAVPRGGGGSSGGGGVDQCNTGTIQCCDSVQSADSGAVTGLLTGLLGLLVGTVTGLVGLTCDPISVIGIGGNSCSAQAACCTGNSFGGIIVLGCSPINLNL